MQGQVPKISRNPEDLLVWRVRIVGVPAVLSINGRRRRKEAELKARLERKWQSNELRLKGEGEMRTKIRMQSGEWHLTFCCTCASSASKLFNVQRAGFFQEGGNRGTVKVIYWSAAGTTGRLRGKCYDIDIH